MEAVTDLCGIDVGGAVNRLAARTAALATNGVALWFASRSLVAQSTRSPSGAGVSPLPRRGAGRCRPTGTVSFLFTDIESSTALWERAPEHMSAALRRHDMILKAQLERRGGAVFARAGDGIGVAFDRPDEAVRAALAAQHALRLESWPAGLPIRVRIGINLGRADERDGDYFGPPVNRAARVTAVAEPGSVLVTGNVVEAACDMNGVDFRDRGEHELRGIGNGIRLFAARPARSEPDRYRPMARSTKASRKRWLIAPLSRT